MATIKPTAAVSVDRATASSPSRPEAERRTSGLRDVSLPVAAVTAGVGLLVMAVLAFLGSAGLSSLIVDGDAAKTAQNIAGHELAYRLSVGSFLVVAVLDVVVAWALYLVLKPVNRGIALVAAWLRVVYAGVFAATLTSLIAAVRFATDAELRNALGPRQADGQTLASADTFTDSWNLALVIFGIHLLVLGYLVARAVYMPVLLGLLVMVSGVGYLIDGVAASLWRGYDVKISAFTFIGEVALLAWLLWRGGRLDDLTAEDTPSSSAASNS